VEEKKRNPKGPFFFLDIFFACSMHLLAVIKRRRHCPHRRKAFALIPLDFQIGLEKKVTPKGASVFLHNATFLINAFVLRRQNESP
jgi:hypothetical protein